MTQTRFAPGDVIDVGGETYQVIEDRGDRGLVIPFPGDVGAASEMPWDAACRRIGNAPLPGPTPCAADGCCPTNGNPLTEEEVFGKRGGR